MRAQLPRPSGHEHDSKSMWTKSRWKARFLTSLFVSTWTLTILIIHVVLSNVFQESPAIRSTTPNATAVIGHRTMFAFVSERPVDKRGTGPNITNGSHPYGPAGGIVDFIFGELPTMSPIRVTEPDERQAAYLQDRCGKLVWNQTKDFRYGNFPAQPWAVSIGILNPHDGLYSLTLKQIAERNKRIRDNITKIESFLPVCGGVIVSPSWVLTAHHCLSENRFLKVVVLGVDDHIDMQGIRHRVKEFDEVHFHPGYEDAMNKHDCAILRLRGEVISGPDMVPACLPNENVIPATGRRCVYSGWGRKATHTKLAGTRLPVITEGLRLNKFQAIVDNPNRCQERYKRLKYDVNFNVCNKPAGVLSDSNNVAEKLQCKGYSGGPLTCEENGRWVVYGIINWGEQSCDETAGRGYALVSTRIKWICCITKVALGACLGIRCL